jgi:gas vesicle protein
MKQYDTEQSNSNSNFLMGLVCGAAVGAAVGLLMAPKSGAELRSQLSSSTEGMRKRAVDGYSTAVHAVSDVVSDVVARGSNAVQRGKSAYEEVRQSATAPTNGMHQGNGAERL